MRIQKLWFSSSRILGIDFDENVYFATTCGFVEAHAIFVVVGFFFKVLIKGENSAGVIL